MTLGVVESVGPGLEKKTKKNRGENKGGTDGQFNNIDQFIH
jgi:hypothetical protein